MRSSELQATTSIQNFSTQSAAMLHKIFRPGSIEPSPKCISNNVAREAANRPRMVALIAIAIQSVLVVGLPVRRGRPVL